MGAERDTQVGAERDTQREELRAAAGGTPQPAHPLAARTLAECACCVVHLQGETWR